MLFSTLLAAAALVEISQGFPAYDQTVEATFPSEAEAARAVCSIARLPNDADIAFCCRWDDTNPANGPKGEMMRNAGVKGSFYFVANDAPYFVGGMKPLVAMGHSIGNHTIDHPHVTRVNPNAAFRSIALGRIKIEAVLQRPVTSYVNPYGWGEQKTSPELARVLAACVVATGHFVTQDNPLDDWSRLSPRSFMPTWRFSANDRKPDRDLFVKGWNAYFPKALASREIPRLTLGTHAWCGKAGDAQQALWLREFALKPDYAQLNDWEYGAYRYQALHGGVRKVGAKGKVATFVVTRFAPNFVGDAIALSLLFTEKPADVRSGGAPLARGRRETWALPQAAGRRLQTAIAIADDAGCSAAFPGLRLEVAPDAKAALCRVTLANDSGKALSNIHIAAAFPPMWTNRRATVNVTSLDSGAKVSQAFPMGAIRHPEDAAGDAFYPVSADFEGDGTVGRLWATKTIKGE